MQLSKQRHETPASAAPAADQARRSRETKLIELNASNRELVRDMKELLADTDAEQSRHNLGIMWKRMRKLHNDQVNFLYEEMEDNDQMHRHQIAARDAVIRQLHVAIDKLEIALEAMSKAANQAVVARNKARADRRVLREQIRKLEDTEKARKPAEDGDNDADTKVAGDDISYAARAAEATGFDLKARLAAMVVELKKVESAKDAELHKAEGAKALLSMQLKDKEDELQKEVSAGRKELEASIDEASRGQEHSTATANVPASWGMSYLTNLLACPSVFGKENDVAGKIMSFGDIRKDKDGGHPVKVVKDGRQVFQAPCKMNSADKAPRVPLGLID